MLHSKTRNEENLVRGGVDITFTEYRRELILILNGVARNTAPQTAKVPCQISSSGGSWSVEGRVEGVRICR